jgi:hypothetical protein
MQCGSRAKIVRTETDVVNCDITDKLQDEELRFSSSCGFGASSAFNPNADILLVAGADQCLLCADFVAKVFFHY